MMDEGLETIILKLFWNILRYFMLHVHKVEYSYNKVVYGLTYFYMNIAGFGFMVWLWFLIDAYG